MVRVVLFSGSTAIALTGGQTGFEVEATRFRGLLLELERRFPGLGQHIEEHMAVALDGVIYQDTYDLALHPGSEICLIPKIVGG
jgi:molybdopterin converting factor small subunit